jgi:hypothetical protein
VLLQLEEELGELRVEKDNVWFVSSSLRKLRGLGSARQIEAHLRKAFECLSGLLRLAGQETCGDTITPVFNYCVALSEMPRLRTILNYLQCMGLPSNETEFLVSQLEGAFCYILGLKE